MKSCKLMALGVLLLIGTIHPAGAQEDMDCDSAETQQAMNICAAQDFEAADGELNEVYGQVKTQLTAADAGIEEADKKGPVDALKKARRGWIDYRDGHCEAYGFQARGGSMEPMMVAGCKADLTRTRPKELQSLLDDGNH